MPDKGVKKRRIIFVQYTYERVCWNNPSADRLVDLPVSTRAWLIQRMHARREQEAKRQQAASKRAARRRRNDPGEAT